jgi:hypothetical protein
MGRPAARWSCRKDRTSVGLEPPGMRRIFLVVWGVAALAWAGMAIWAIRQPETERRAQVRTAAFCVWFGSGLLTPTIKPQKGTRNKERF